LAAVEFRQNIATLIDISAASATLFCHVFFLKIATFHLCHPLIYQGVEKRHERRQDKAKSNEKAEFMCDK
jgi:hypothetical protein